MKWRFCCAVLVLIVGVFLPLSPASTWTRSGDDATGAPAVAPGQDGLVEARKAAGEASAQAGFLTQGTGQLVDGVSQLDTSSQELINAIAAAQTGSQELSNGMVQLQAGTGQLAGGATQVADAIGGVADQVAGFDAVRGQVVATIDRTLESTKDAKDPDVKEARTALEGLRGQAETAQLPPEMLGQLEELRKGSRDVANQLSVPGYAYHDGIYSATNGAAELANGLTTLNDQASGATDGVTQLQEGAAKIDEMANKTSDQIAAVRKAMPAAAGANSGAAGAGARASEAPAPRSTLAPVAAMLIAALVRRPRRGPGQRAHRRDRRAARARPGRRCGRERRAYRRAERCPRYPCWLAHRGRPRRGASRPGRLAVEDRIHRTGWQGLGVRRGRHPDALDDGEPVCRRQRGLYHSALGRHVRWSRPCCGVVRRREGARISKGAYRVLRFAGSFQVIGAWK
ncbi:hypothetical protein CKJ84_10050 [Corynebacterium sp. NML 120412]|uniref:hypothetical protein n=1 Tax=Corynebacterium sp. NML 120412 TaxID=2029401 RepID=UPI000BAA754D|nr:hypothetical protein [Corynebacterium sp. NML 120412]PAT14169.1 hypothetical protein CKJ84_10050 [Corynebacterium sp. NML 120412]